MESTGPAVRIRWEPEEVVPGLFRIPLPHAFGSSVNVLAIPDPEGVLLVDAGYPSEEGRAIFDDQLRRLELTRRDVRVILLTHADPDHVGFARDLQRESGARVLLHPRELDRGPLWRGSLAWLEANGCPVEGLDHRPEPPRLPERIDTVEDGQRIAWAGFDLRLLLCPGHTPGLLCAHDRERRLLLSTDHVLRSAPTPVGLFSAEGDPFGDYLESIERLHGLEVETVVPGHGRAFSGLEARLAAITAGVDRELERVGRALGPEPTTAWEIAGQAHPDPDPRRRFMAVFMVLAALRRLERAGRAAAVETNGRISYRAA